MIEGYPHEASVLPGDELQLHVSTDAPHFRVELFRAGATTAHVATTEWFDGHLAAHHLPFQDWGTANVDGAGTRLEAWPAYRITIPSEWPSGVYVALLIEGAVQGTRRGARSRSVPRTKRFSRSILDGRTARALFVVRNRSSERGAVLYKLPLLTYHAYNEVAAVRPDERAASGAWCLYTVPRSDTVGDPIPSAVSLRRPGGGIGGTPWDIWNRDPFDATPRQSFVHWDALFIHWLECRRCAVDYCTDCDIHADVEAALLDRYELLVSAGHDEYWTDAMRTNVERFVDSGGNVAFFGGNTCWWRVEFDDGFSFRRTEPWSSFGRPENMLTGVSYRNGGERGARDSTTPVGYRVQHARHWVYDATGVRDGEVFGDAENEALVGYECDGAHFDRRSLSTGTAVTPTGRDGTPAGFEILGVGDVGAAGWGLGNKAATLGVHEPGGTVFTASTTDWPRVLARGNPVVDRITRNVLERLAPSSAG